jgi:hypothetical protein
MSPGQVLQWAMVSVLKTGFDNPVLWIGAPEERKLLIGAPEERKLHESGFNSIR